jgi:hypothetical protein
MKEIFVSGQRAALVMNQMQGPGTE